MVAMDRAELGRALVAAAYLEGDFVLSSGQRSRYYLDKYLFSTEPRLLGAIARHLAPLVPLGTQRLAGVELGGVPLVTALSLESGLPFVIVRKGQKEHGTARRIEGVLKPGERVTLVEDIWTTARQAVAAAGVLREAGAEVAAILAVVDREQGGPEAIRQAGFEPRPLFTRTELGIRV
jgi:orotate phosphoribosyltransferase